jgi:hypothetical protein
MSHMTSTHRFSDYSGRRHFVVAQNAHGYWVAREERGLIEGVFVNQRDAIRFALFETGNRSASVAAGGQPTQVAQQIPSSGFSPGALAPPNDLAASQLERRRQRVGAPLSILQVLRQSYQRCGIGR